MDDRQKAKLERYFRNSSRFLWGLVPPDRRNQKESYAWLRGKGCRNFKEGRYRYVIAQLLDDPGIERLLTDVVIPRVRDELFTAEFLKYLRQRWNEGHPPEMSDLHEYGVKVEKPKDALPLVPFLEVNTQYSYVERWGEFAGLWFEEIEPNIGSEGV